MAANAFSSSKPKLPDVRIPSGTFGESAARTRSSMPTPRSSAASYEILALPPSAPASEIYPDIESALIAASDQLQRSAEWAPEQPAVRSELPALPRLYRRAK
jgi:hypothetical protein